MYISDYILKNMYRLDRIWTVCADALGSRGVLKDRSSIWERRAQDIEKTELRRCRRR